MALKSGVVLADNEHLVEELEAELYATSSNPIAKLLGSILRLLWLVVGVKKRGYLVITDKRVIEVKSNKVCWVFNSSHEVKIVLPSSIKEIGYKKAATFCCCFCQAYTLYYESYTQTTEVLLSSVTSSRDAQRLVDAFYNAISYRGQF